MSVPPDILIGPRLKVQRAYRHIDELRTRSAPLDRKLYTFAVEKQRQWHLGAGTDFSPRDMSVLRYLPKEPIAEVFALIIGDALHNLRSALDHLATGIARTVDSGAQVHFPMSKIRSDLVAPRLPKGPAEKAFAAIERALPGSERLILDDIRPDAGPDERFWSFHTLNNDDKHNLLIPTVTIAMIENLNIEGFGFLTKNFGAGGDATKPFNIFASDQTITIEQSFDTTVDIRLSHIDVLKDEPAIPALTQIAGIVSHTIDKLEGLIRNEELR